jgi:transcriptional antiterminator NusG
MGIYVFQVTPGEERKAAQRLLRRTAPRATCFVPEVEVPVRTGAGWSRVRRPLVVGYVFVQTSDIQKVRQEALEAPGFARLLRMGGSVLSLTPEEEAWLGAVCSQDGRVAPVSTGIVEGGTTRILSGPLVGREVSIKKIDRHKRLAYVEVQMFGRTLTVQVGLELTGKTAATA